MSGGSTTQTISGKVQIAGAVVTTIGSVTAIVMAVLAYLAWTDARQTAKEQRADAIAARKEARSPYLAFDQQSSVVGLVKSPIGWDVNRDERAQSEHGYPTIKNYGPGPAMDCSVQYHITSINGKFLDKPRLSNDVCRPMNIMPNMSGRIYTVPTPIFTDDESEIRDLQGTAIFRCKTIDGEFVKQAQEFKMYTDYDQMPPKLTIITAFLPPPPLEPDGKK